MRRSSYRGRWSFHHFLPPIRLKCKRHCSILSPAAALPRPGLTQTSTRTFNHSAFVQQDAVPELETDDERSHNDGHTDQQSLGKVLNAIDSCLLSKDSQAEPRKSVKLASSNSTGKPFLKHETPRFDNVGHRPSMLPQSEDLLAEMDQALRRKSYYRVIQLFEGHTGDSPTTSIAKPDSEPIPGHISTLILNNYLLSLIHLGYIQEVEDAVVYYDNASQLHPDQRTYELLLKAYLKSINMSKARGLLKEMLIRNIKIGRGTMINLLKTETRYAFRIGSVDALLELVSSHGIDVQNMECYNAILDAYLRRDRPDRARALLDDMAKSNHQPSAESYRALLKHQAEKAGPEGVAAILHSMKKQGIEPDIRHLNVWLGSLIDRRRHLSLTDLPELFSPYRCKPDVYTGNLILRGIFKRQEFTMEDLNKHFEELAKLEISPNHSTFEILLYQYGRKNENARRVQEVLEAQVKKNPDMVSRVSIKVLLHRVLSSGSHDRDSTPNISQLRPQWTLDTVASLAASYCRGAIQIEKLLKLYDGIKQRNVKMDRWFYRIITKAFISEKRYEKCKEAIVDILSSDDRDDLLFARETQLRLDLAIYKDTVRNKRKDKLDRVMKSIDNLLKFSAQAKRQLTEKATNLIAIAFLETGNTRLCIEILESRYHGSGLFEDLETQHDLGWSSWTILMRAYARKAKVEIGNLRWCMVRVEKTLSDTVPYSTFVELLERLANLPELAQQDSEYFQQKAKEFRTRLQTRKAEEPLTSMSRGRGSLSKSMIMTWVNSKGERKSDKVENSVE